MSKKRSRKGGPAQGGVMLRRTLTEWERTVAQVPPRLNLQGEETEEAYRNARPTKEVGLGG